MEVRLLVHGEPTESGRLVWWIESPEFAGFSAAGDTLVEARIRAEQAIAELADGADLVFRYELVEPDEAVGPTVERSGGFADEPHSVGSPSATLVA